MLKMLIIELRRHKNHCKNVQNQIEEYKTDSRANEYRSSAKTGKRELTSDTRKI